MKKKIGLLIVAISMVISLLIQPVFATNTNDDDELLDVVLVLDQSGSMKQNDPNGLMKEAAKTFITMLPSNSRGNIITFNRSRSMWKNDLTELSDDDTTKSAASWVSDVEYTGDTDMSNAVADAINMFDVNDGRVHAILLFSDGRNDFGYEKNKEIESDERLNDALALAKNAGIQVYCIGYGEEMVNTSDVPYQKLDSIAIADSDNRITTQTDAKSINDYFNTVIAELMGSNTIPVVDNKIEIASNVKEANINISCNDKVNDAGIKLIDNNGNEVNFNNNQNAKLYLYEYSAVIKLYEPVAGTYTIVTNKNINISATYIPYYQYVLNTSIIDNNGNEVSSLSNGDTLTIVTSIQQDGKIVTTPDTYKNLNAVATVTAMDNKKSQEVPLSYNNGQLIGSVVLDHVALYSIDIVVGSDSFNLTDHVEIQADKQPIAIDKQIAIDKLGKQTLDKTFKSSVTKDISMDTLTSIIDDPDDVGFKVSDVKSSDTDKVTVKLSDDGIRLTGTNWGSSTVTVSYEDDLGNKVTTSFSVKVVDKALVVFFAAIPFIIGLIVLIIVLLILRKSRLIKGDFTITSITVNNDLQSFSIGILKTYPSNIFLRKRKTLATGITQYSNDVYNQAYNQRSEMLYNILNQETTIKKALDSVKFIGTYLGRNGLKLVVKHPNVSYGNNMRYGIAVKESWKTDKSFAIYVRDESGLELLIEGNYRPNRFAKKKDEFNDNMAMFEQNSGSATSFGNDFNSDFDDFNNFK